MKGKTKITVACFALLCLSLVAWIAWGRERRQTKVTYSEFLEQVNAGQVAGVIIDAGHSGASRATYRRKDGVTERTVLPSHYRDAMDAMRDKGVDIEIEEVGNSWVSLLINASPFLVLLAFWIFMMRGFRNGRKLGSAGLWG